MAEEDQEEYEPEEDDDSLERFEEEILKGDQEKSRTNLVRGVLFVVMLGAIGFYGYDKYYLPSQKAAQMDQTAQAPEPQAPMDQANVDDQFSEPAPDEGMDMEEPAGPEEMEDMGEAEDMGEEPTAPFDEQVADEAPMELPEMASTTPEQATPEPEPMAQPEPEPAAQPAPEPKKMAKTSMPKEPEMRRKAAPRTQSGRTHTLHVGLYTVPANAADMMKKLKKLGLEPSAYKVSYHGRGVAVYAGKYPFKELAQDAADSLRNKGFKPEVALVKAGEYSLKMGAFNSESESDMLTKALEDQGFSIQIKPNKQEIPATSVRLKDADGEVEALLKRKNIDFFRMR